MGFGTQADDGAQAALRAARAHFSPELMGRLDEVVVFHPLAAAQRAQVAEMLLEELERRCAGAGVTLRHTGAAAAALAERWYDARAGARSLRRAIAKEVEQRLARQMLCGGEGDFLLDARDGSLVLTAPAGAGV